MIKDATLKMIQGQHLSTDEMVEAMNQIMTGDIDGAEIAGFLTALKMKGEAVSEIFGGAKVLREKAVKLDLADYYTVDTCGTGGDASETYNISTAVSIVTAAAGVTVVKHGNRAVSSKCGAADVLEALGVNVNLEAPQVEQCVKEIGIGFLFAPKFHSAMRFVGPTRKALGFRTIFNILGPLANPASANAQVMGVFDEKLTEPLAEVLMNLGVEKALVVHGMDGMDEISISAETKVSEIKDGKVETYRIKPEDFGMTRQDASVLAGGEAEENAQIIRDVLAGQVGGKLDILLLNAGAALYVGKKVDSIKAGIDLARDLINSGKASEKLEAFAAYTQAF